MKLLILDNYDSFTYNLYSYLKQLGVENVDVFLNNKISLNEVDRYDRIIISPGPRLPKDAGITMDLLKNYHYKKHILGICLGNQAIGEFFGAKLKNLGKVKHGISSKMTILTKDTIYKNIPKNINIGHYHSWVLDTENFPSDLEILSYDIDKNIMSIKHKKYNIYGIQYHPESILTDYGKDILKNWLEC